MKLTGNTEGLSYATEKSAGFDIRSTVDVVIPPLEGYIVPTGLYIDLDSVQEPTYVEQLGVTVVRELQIRPKSGVAWNNYVIVLNSPGTVDGDYPNEIGVILFNLSSEDFIVERGDKIAQGVHALVVIEDSIPVKQIKRVGGFGSTGVK